MERIVYQDIIKWSKNKERKPLILNGARQVGKTWLLKELAKKEYAKTAENQHLLLRDVDFFVNVKVHKLYFIYSYD